MVHLVSVILERYLACVKVLVLLVLQQREFLNLVYEIGALPDEEGQEFSHGLQFILVEFAFEVDLVISADL